MKTDKIERNDELRLDSVIIDDTRISEIDKTKIKSKLDSEKKEDEEKI